MVVFINTVTRRDGRSAGAARREEREYLSYFSDEQRRRTGMRRSSNAIVFMNTTTKLILSQFPTRGLRQQTISRIVFEVYSPTSANPSMGMKRLALLD